MSCCAYFSLHEMMHSHKSFERLRTGSAAANSCDVQLTSISRHSVSADRDSRLLLLHRKCPDPSVCVRGAFNDSPSAVPLIGISPIICQPLTCRPRLRPVAAVPEVADISIVGNGLSTFSTNAPLVSHLSSAKQHQLRRRTYTRQASISQSADCGRQEKHTSNVGNQQDKGHSGDIYIPVASSSPCINLALEDIRSGDNIVHDFGTQPNGYYLDAVQHDGGLKMEHIEYPRPLPPRHDIHTSDGKNEHSASPEDCPFSRLDLLATRRCVTDSELRPSRHFVCDQCPNVARSYTYDRPFRSSLPVANSCQPASSGDSERTFYRVSPVLNQNANSRTASVDVTGAMCRCSSGRCGRGNIDRHQWQHLKKSVSDVGRQISHSVRHSDRLFFGDSLQIFPGNQTSECGDKYVP